MYNKTLSGHYKMLCHADHYTHIVICLLHPEGFYHPTGLLLKYQRLPMYSVEGLEYFKYAQHLLTQWLQHSHSLEGSSPAPCTLGCWQLV